MIVLFLVIERTLPKEVVFDVYVLHMVMKEGIFR